MSPSASEPSELDKIKAEVAQSRADLADTVDELAGRLNVKTQAKAKAQDVRQAAAQKTTQLKQSLPPQVQRAMDTVGAKAAPHARRANELARPHRSKILAGTLAAAVLLIALRRRGEDES